MTDEIRTATGTETQVGRAPVPPPPQPRVPDFKYQSFDDSPDSTHRLVLSLVPEGARVLEVGCATGYMSRVLGQELRSSVVGIELSPEAAEAARSSCERVIVGDIEELDLAEELQGESFDVVLFADVLEHLRDPAATLRRVLPFIGEPGYVVASIPNVAHASVRLALLRGEFRYREQGLLDDTHLRFFTRDTIEELFEASGYVVTDWLRRRIDLGDSEIDVAEPPAELAEILAHTDATTYQFVVRAVPSEAAPRLAATVALLDDARKELEELRLLRSALEEKDVEREAVARELEVEATRIRRAHEALGQKLLAERAAHAEIVGGRQEEAAERDAEREEAYRWGQKELHRLETENARLSAEVEALDEALRLIQESRSVRYTAPLRALARPLRRRE